MKHFFAVGSANKGPHQKILKEEGVRRVLFTYGDLAGHPEISHNMAGYGEVIVDSGAYSVGHAGKDISMKDYLAYLTMLKYTYPKSHDKVVGCINFDDMANSEKTLANQRAFESEGLTVLPVYHFGEDRKYLEMYVAEGYPWICLGGIAVGTVNTAKLKIWWDGIAQQFPGTRFHLLGTTQWRAFVDHQPYSIDGTGWMAGHRGNLMCVAPDGGPSYNFTLSLNEDQEMDFGSLGGKSIKYAEIPKHFFTYQELWRHNIRAMLYFEKMEWVKEIHKNQQGNLFDIGDRNG